MSGKGYVPPASVAKAAARGLEYRKKAGGKGGLDVKQASAQGIGSGVQRATNLKNRDAISADTVRRMKAFFDRHAKNKDVAAGKEPWEDRGHVAWLLWGGDPGRKWANSIVAKLNESEAPLRDLTEELRVLTEAPRTPPQVKRCVAKVAGKVQDVSRAFAICVAQMQKSGQIKPGTMELTGKGKKRARSKAAKKDYSAVVDKYEKALTKARKESVLPAMRALLESNYDADKVAADLLAVCPPNRMNHCKRALEVVLPAYAGGEDIYNADYKDAKDTLGRVIDDAWNDHVFIPFLAAKGGGHPQSAFYEYMGMVMSAHDMLAKKKKLDKLKPTTKLPGHNHYTVKDVDPAMVDAVTRVVHAGYPIAVILKALKSKVVKGRKPASKEVQAKRAAMLAKKDMKTCPCCFRSIARLKNGMVADHGYTLNNRWGMGKSASCPGRQFRPLEVSSRGLRYMIRYLKDRVASLEKSKRAAPGLKTLMRRAGYGGKMEKIEPDHPAWDETYKAYLLNLESEIKHTENGLRDLESRLRVWKKTAD